MADGEEPVDGELFCCTLYEKQQFTFTLSDFPGDRRGMHRYIYAKQWRTWRRLHMALCILQCPLCKALLHCDLVDAWQSTVIKANNFPKSLGCGTRKVGATYWNSSARVFVGTHPIVFTLCAQSPWHMLYVRFPHTGRGLRSAKF